MVRRRLNGKFVTHTYKAGKLVLITAEPGEDFPSPPAGTAGVCGFDAFGNKVTWVFPGVQKYFKGGPEGVQSWTNT